MSRLDGDRRYIVKEMSYKYRNHAGQDLHSNNGWASMPPKKHLASSTGAKTEAEL